MIYRLPASFTLDAVSRGVCAGPIVHITRDAVWVDLFAAQVDELRSDAAYYADPDAGMPASYRTGARSTIAGLDAGPVDPPKPRARRPWTCPACGTQSPIRPAHRLCVDCR